MSHSEKCPICEGRRRNFDDSLNTFDRVCGGCNGLGWITVADEKTKSEYVTWHVPLM